MKTLLLYLVTAIAEIVGCYLPLLWLRGQGSGCCCCPQRP
jgi:small multidrug resistance family-3 protein